MAVQKQVARDWTQDEVALVRMVVGRCWESPERARVVRALRESEVKYRTLFTSIDEGFCVIEVLFDENAQTTDYRFLEVNPAFEKQTGLKDAVGRTIHELVLGLESHWFEVYGRVARTGESDCRPSRGTTSGNSRPLPVRLHRRRHAPARSAAVRSGVLAKAFHPLGTRRSHSRGA